MFKGWWHVVPDDERPQWTLDPYVSVGPLRFGMRAAEVEDTVSGMTADTGHRRFTGRGNAWELVEATYREFGLHLYYDGQRLTGVVVDALCGPQVLADGVPLVGQVPSVVERWMTERAEQRPPDTELAYMSAGVPASRSLGVTVNVQREGDRLLTRPIFYPAEALDDLSHWLPRDTWSIHD
ncbi:hypothetical protein [Kitasatospora sp. NPDC056273]|uniref:hypothetical protein n=1 Tax=Kitasatospora sp. NPDC056273 TaxID=3345769 RepID=UPI0035E10349